MSNSEKALDKEALSAIIINFFERFSLWEETMAEEAGLTPRQCHTVIKIGEAGGVQMKTLAELLGITTGTLTILIGRLQKQGLCSRVSDASDKRVYHIELTPAGKAIYQKHKEQHSRLMEEIFARLSGEDCAALGKILEQLSVVLGGNQGK